MTLAAVSPRVCWQPPRCRGQKPQPGTAWGVHWGGLGRLARPSDPFQSAAFTLGLGVSKSAHAPFKRRALVSHGPSVSSTCLQTRGLIFLVPDSRAWYPVWGLNPHSLGRIPELVIPLPSSELPPREWRQCGFWLDHFSFPPTSVSMFFSLYPWLYTNRSASLQVIPKENWCICSFGVFLKGEELKFFLLHHLDPDLAQQIFTLGSVNWCADPEGCALCNFSQWTDHGS